MYKIAAEKAKNDIFLQILAKKAKKIYNPDWIINNDADEFWVPTVTESLKDTFERVVPYYDKKIK